MKWNWELADWPNFTYTSPSSLEAKFLQIAGGNSAVLRHLSNEDKNQFIIEILCSEGLKSSEIEGEILERESLQSSIQRHFGLHSVSKKRFPKERGMADLMWDVYSSYKQPLTHEMLFNWHSLLMDHESKVLDTGKYRTHEDPMQIVSGRYDKQIVYFEAPPSDKVLSEMTKFITWFNDTEQESSILIKASIAHVYFESIHPFEDGNGRIGRALIEKMLSQKLGCPVLLAVSQIISIRKKEYYSTLQKCNTTLEIDPWIQFFSQVIVEAQNESFNLVQFLMNKSKMMNYLEGKINNRQEKALLRIFLEGPKGFSGGLSAENYISITKTSRPTATRDLSDLVDLKALYKTGKLRHTRYWLNLDFNS